jgi:hypothetical protein
MGYATALLSYTEVYSTNYAVSSITEEMTTEKK